VTLQEQIRSNRFRTAVVMLGFVALVFALGAAASFAYEPGLLGIIGIIGIGYGIVSYYASGRIVAAASGAKPVTREQEPELYRLVENVSIAAGLTHTPAVYVVEDGALNAFAAGRTPDVAYIAVTRGLLQNLDRRRLEGVIAHEIAHIRNRDVRLMTIVTVLVGVIALAADMLMRVGMFGGGRRDDRGSNGLALIVGLAAAILAPISAALLQMSLSRKREYLADASAAEITGDPEGMALALAALRDHHQPLRTVTRATAHLYIESPLRDHRGLRSSLGGLFDTHPPLEDRIARLEQAGGFMLPPPLETVEQP
jgi:heat shock protein HtpX